MPLPATARDRALATWLLFAIAVTIPPFLWHVAQFAKPGPAYLAVLLAALASLLALAALLTKFRAVPAVRRATLVALAAPLLIAVAYRPAAALGVIVIAASAWLLGAEILARLKFEVAGSAAAIAFPTLTGLGAFTYVLFVLAQARLLAPWAMLVLLAAPLLFARRLATLRRAAASLACAWQDDPDLRLPLVSIAAAFSLAFISLTAVMTVLPPTAFDVINAHLPLARRYFESRSFEPPAANAYGWYPQAFEILGAMSWMLGREAAPQMLSAVFFSLAALLIVAIVRSCGRGRAPAFLASALGASIPLVHWTGSVAKNDLAMDAWMLAALYCVLQWQASRRFRWILLSAFMLGLAFQVKHVALFGAPPLFILWAAAAWREPRRLRAASLVAACFLLFGTFSVVRTWAATGDPVYPQSPSAGIRPVGHRAPLERAVRWASLPVTIHFHAGRFFESSSENPMGVAFVLFAPLLLAPCWRAQTPDRISAFFAAAYLLYWSVIIGMPRYAIPALWILAALIAPRLAAAAAIAAPWMRGLLAASLAWVMSFAWVVAVMIGSYPLEFAWLARRVDDRAYLKSAVPAYGAMEFLSRRGGEALNVGACASLYGPGPDLVHEICEPADMQSLKEVAQVLQRYPKVQWVVLPANTSGENLAASLDRIRPLRRVYGDPWFFVCALDLPAP